MRREEVDARRSRETLEIAKLRSCMRCGSDHEAIVFARMLRPVEIEGGAPLTHWALCPETNDPVLLRVEAKG